MTKSQLLIIEGVDCIGKSTYIQNVVSNMLHGNVAVVHFDAVVEKSTSEFIEYVKRGILDAYKSLSKDEDRVVICDRYILSEIIYAEAFGRHDRTQNTKLTSELADSLLFFDMIDVVIMADHSHDMRVLHERYLEKTKTSVEPDFKDLININNMYIKERYNMHRCSREILRNKYGLPVHTIVND